MQAMTVIFPVLAGALAGLLAAIVYHRRQVVGMRALLDRLDALSTATAPDSVRRSEVERWATEPNSSGDSSLSAVTADVLAGRTTQIRKLLENGQMRGLPLADQAIVQIYNRIDQTLTPSELANALHVSLRSLERGLSLALNCSPRELILAAKMREARRLLQSNELNVTGVAYRLGFSSPSHFSRRFRAFFKQSPSDVARRIA
ncbi:MAG: helix-turn-helix transcriptional regulator [Acidobacteriota bacterium]|jgi:AraC-like DNA-binding protein